MNMFEFNILKMLTLDELCRLLNNLKRWSSDITESGRNELGKQALNVICCYILAIEYEVRTGKNLNWSLFPKIALFRAFQKAYVNVDIRENTLHEIEGSENPQKLFNEVTERVIEHEADEEFRDYIKEGCESIEESIFKAATKIATLLELLEIKNKVHNFRRVYYEVVSDAKKYYDIPGFRSIFKKLKRKKWKIAKEFQKNTIKVLEDVSTLRNRDRWSVYSHPVKCSVLGHLFETAAIAYFVSLEHGLSEKNATTNFFVGAFHDVAEVYTGDIPSPIKDYIRNFRKRSEEFELRMMNENFYPYLPSYLEKAVRDVMLEEPKNSDRKGIIKIADYVSAVSEVHRQAVKGSHDRELYKALVGHRAKLRFYDAGKIEMMYYEYVEKYCRKTMLLGDTDYYLAAAEMTCRNILRINEGFMTDIKKYKMTKKLYRRFLLIERYFNESETDDIEKTKFAALKEKCRKFYY